MDLFTHVAACAPMSSPASAQRRRIPFTVFDGEGVAPRTITPAGRDAWALAQLIISGSEGCTPITHVGPRWSGYLHKLRHVYGLNVETIDEQHGGEFSGRHARYVLISRVAFADPADATRHGGAQ